jgi:hypothetical protein
MTDIPVPAFADIPASTPCAHCGHEKREHVPGCGYYVQRARPCGCSWFDGVQYVAQVVDRAARVDELRKHGLRRTSDGVLHLDPKRLAQAARAIEHEFVGFVFAPGEAEEIAQSVLYDFLQEPPDD